ncbi:MAG: helicase C-terminal domain-containing protein [Myxococcota bacterium]
MFASAIPEGLSGQQLLATYDHVSKPAFQDELGALLIQLCRVVPNGLLVFFPSYSTLEKLRRRWKATGALENIQAAKTLVVEPRSSGVAFDTASSTFCSEAKSDRGAVFFAVCRGKVSEGMDFKDE